MMDNVQNIAQDDYCTLKKDAIGSSKMCMLHSIAIQNTTILKLAIFGPLLHFPHRKMNNLHLLGKLRGLPLHVKGLENGTSMGEVVTLKQQKSDNPQNM
jgi:hypothetical protein